MNTPLSPCVPENLVSRDGFSRPVPRQPAHLHTQAESGAYLRDSSRVPRRRPFMKPPYAIGSVPSLSGHAIAYRWQIAYNLIGYKLNEQYPFLCVQIFFFQRNARERQHDLRPEATSSHHLGLLILNYGERASTSPLALGYSSILFLEWSVPVRVEWHNYVFVAIWIPVGLSVAGCHMM